jgi:hypothetical protein
MKPKKKVKNIIYLKCSICGKSYINNHKCKNRPKQDKIEKLKYKLSKLWNRLVDKDVHGNIADILPIFYGIAEKQGEDNMRKRICEIIDWCIGYNQFNSIGEQSRMIEVKELLAKINSEKIN